jgi:cardiolipin synthase
MQVSEGDGASVVASPPGVSGAAVLTIPNALSASRLVGVPLFLWLLLGPHADVLALVVLMYAGVSDWADGVLARKLNQLSRLGELLDPAADRLYIVATLVGLVVRGILPAWLALAIVAREVVLGIGLLVLRRYDYGPPPVHYLGKAATFNLLYAFPLLLLADRSDTLGHVVAPFAWAFTIWGSGLYFWSAGLYLLHTATLVRAARQEERG